MKTENPKQYIPPKPKMQLIVEEFDGSRYELELFQVDSGIYKIFDVSAGNRWCDTLLAENNNWTFSDYAEIIDSYTMELVEIKCGSKTYEREMEMAQHG